MIKKFALATAFALATIGLAAAPANAAPTGTLNMHSGTNFTGDFAILSEGAINTNGNCTQVPLVPAGLKAVSASNTTVGTGTMVTEVTFFSTATCAVGDRLGDPLRPGDVNTNFGTPAASHYKAALVAR